MEELQDRFAQVEAEIERGNTDRLGFRKLVREVKSDPRLSEHWADTVGRIDRKLFEARVRPRFPMWFGNGLLLTWTVLLAALVPVALRLAERGEPALRTAAGVLLLAAGGGLAVAVHAPAHWLVGRLVGIRFIGYFLDGPFRIQPGVKTDQATYLRASPGARAAMHAAGAVATKLMPFAVFLPAYLRHASAGYELLPEWSLWGLLGIGVLQIVTDVLWSTRYSDWKKVRRELRLGRIQSAS